MAKRYCQGVMTLLAYRCDHIPIRYRQYLAGMEGRCGTPGGIRTRIFACVKGGLCPLSYRGSHLHITNSQANQSTENRHASQNR